MPKFNIALNESDSHVCYFQHKHTFISQSAGKLVKNKKYAHGRIRRSWLSSLNLLGNQPWCVLLCLDNGLLLVVYR